MAAVYLAHDLKHERPVALKVMRPELAATLGPARFLREIRLCARLQHPHILAVLDSGTVGSTAGGTDLLWFTMPFVEGESLRGRLTREGQLPVADAVRIAREVADGLHHAHQHGVIHRDIKPENILLSGGHALIADFGIARAPGTDGEQHDRLTETGTTLGTPQYMSPEQATGERVLDPRTDIYSLGCVLYEMLAGEPPFTGPNQQAILAKRLTGTAPRPSTVREVPPAIDRTVERALARSPGDRFATAADFAAALDSAALDIPRQAPREAFGRRRAAALAVAAGLTMAVLGGYLAIRGDEGPAPRASAAVLPFVDLSAERDQEYFSDGLTEELITSLSQIEGLRVAARTSSFQFKDRNADVREVGRSLDVGAVVEGSVRRSGSRLRVAAQLVNAEDGYQLWSQVYDRELTDVFAVQEEIARAIVQALRVELGVARSAALSKAPTRDLEAYDLYLRGRFAWNNRSAAALPQAVRYLQQAVARDSGFARAWAALADAYVLVVPYAGWSREEIWPKAKAAAQQALALDGTLAEAHTSLAYGTMIYDWDWAAAEASFRRAIAADPNYPTAHQWYADFLAGRGRLEESLREMQRAHALDPLSRIIGVELGWVYYQMGLNQEAEAQLRRTLALDPNYPHALLNLGLVFLVTGRYAEAIDTLGRAIDLGGDYDPLNAALVTSHARAGDLGTARRLLGELTARAARGEVGQFGLAIAYTGLGETDSAFAALHRAIDQRDIFLPEVFSDPLLDPLRQDPRFARILERVGLARQTGEGAAR
jgi:TolB-like protein/Tfp pilus assembly protein PilF